MATGRISLLWFCFLSIFLFSATFVRCDDAEEPDDDDGVEEDGPAEEEGVYVLTEDNFDTFVADNDVILVEFYAPWCGHCKALAPEYAKAAKALKILDYPVALGKVDATTEPDLAKRFEVSGYPTMKWFKDGQPNDYDGPREAEGIVDYMTARADPDFKPPPAAVLTLDDDNFKDTVDTEELILVEFYAPWCGHCKKLAPEYERAAQKLQDVSPPIPLAKVDATQATEVAKEYGVTGYPTLKLFRKGKASDYSGPRDEAGIVSYMIRQQGDASKLFDAWNMKQMKAHLNIDDVTVFGFFKDDKDPLYETYMEASNVLREEFIYGHTFDEAARSVYKVNPGSVVVFNAERFYTKHEPKWHVFEKKDATTEELKKFLKDKQIPLVGQYTKTSESRYRSFRPLCIFLYTVDWSFDHREATQLWRRKLADMAKIYTGLTFAIADEDELPDFMKAFGFEDSGEELNLGCIDRDDWKYAMEPMEEYDSDDVREFLDKFERGKLTPRIKSQPIPKKDSGPVVTVVGKTFNDIVLDETKDVLIEFYAPWCGHCKNLEPIYKKVAKEFKDEPNVVIAKIDATANDSPPIYKTQGFPTIYFAPADSKEEPIQYQGSRTKEDIVKFVKENAAASFGKMVKEEL